MIKPALFALVSLALSVLPAYGAAAGAAASGSSAVADADNAFCFRLLTQLDSGKPNQNVLISPFSISSALSMALNGAKGSTQDEIASALTLDNIAITQINAGNRALLTALNEPSAGVQISAANALWADERMTFAPTFAAICKIDYDASARTLNFASPDASAAINDWVSDKTKGHIPTIVDPSALRPGGAVLTNAVYFHGKWSMPFDPNNTRPADFTMEDGTTQSVPMMSAGDWTVPYCETSAYQAIALPYGDKRFSLTVVLPAKGATVETVAELMNPTTWNAMESSLHPTLIRIGLPKFSAKYSVTLNGALSGLGMGGAFQEGADFTPMGMPPKSCIDAVLHKATLDVDEEGTTATAATAVVMRALAMPMPQKSFIADHPFFYAIRDSQTGAIVFTGIIRDPKS